MSSDQGESPHSTAIDELESLGLSTYASRTFVALTSLGIGTAKDVSEISDVPRTRVYDAVEELQQRGIVDVQDGKPRRFWAVSSETASGQFEREFHDRITNLRSALEALQPVERRAEQRGVWTVDAQAAITDRVREFCRAAEEEIVYMTVEELLTEEIVETLQNAAERGVAIKLAGISPAVQTQIQEQIPGAETFESLWLWSDTPAGRLLMVDRDRCLVSVRSEGATTERTETAIWGTGESNSLVVVLRGIFTWRLEGD